MTLRIYLHVTNTCSITGQLVIRNEIIVNKIIMNPLAGYLTILYQLIMMCSVKCDMLMGYKQKERRDMVKATTVNESLLHYSIPVTNHTTTQKNCCGQSINN
jgi:hypothetical protein